MEPKYICRTRPHIVLLIAAIIICAAGLPSFAAGENKRETVSVYINGRPLYTDLPLLIGNVTYVPLDSFRRAAGDDLSTLVMAFDNYIAGGGRYIYNDNICFCKDGVVYVPLRSAARLYLASVTWDAEKSAAYVACDRSAVVPGEAMYADEDVYWLSRIIEAESGSEPFNGKLAVGAVIMNRIDSPDFPDTVKDVIFDDKFGVQFTPTANGTVYNEPSEESVITAKMCLEGYRVSNSILYFLQEALARNKWTVYNRSFELSIGNHDFYS